MISEAMAFYGLHRDFKHAGYFPITQNEKIFDGLKVAVQQGQLVVLSGIVGAGKSKLLRRIKDDLQRENKILVGIGHMKVYIFGKPYPHTLHIAFKANKTRAETPRSSKGSC